MNSKNFYSFSILAAIAIAIALAYMCARSRDRSNKSHRSYEYVEDMKSR